MKTEISTVHTFDWQGEEDYNNFLNFIQENMKNKNIQYLIELNEEIEFTITLNHNNLEVNVEEFIDIQDTLFNNVSEELEDMLLN